MKILIAAVAILVYLAFQHQWYFVLSGDIRNYYFPIATGIRTVQTLIYSPGANLFFSLFPTVTFEIYQSLYIFLNIGILFAFAKLTRRPVILSFLLLSAGPIVLFRFDLWVIILIALGLMTFEKGQIIRSGFFLGVATATKVFPLILVPFLFLAFGKFEQKIKFVLSFILAVTAILFIYLSLFRVGPLTIIEGFKFTFSRAVQMESVPASVLTMATSLTNPGPHGVDFIDARWAISPLYLLGHSRIFRFLVPVGLAVAYLAVFLRWRKTRGFSVLSCILIILSLVITTPAFSPQYVLWPAFLYLLVPNINKLDLALIILALICTQVIYPLNYGEMVDFYNRGINQHLFWINALRNLTLVILALRIFKRELYL